MNKAGQFLKKLGSLLLVQFLVGAFLFLIPPTFATFYLMIGIFVINPAALYMVTKSFELSIFLSSILVFNVFLAFLIYLHYLNVTPYPGIEYDLYVLAVFNMIYLTFLGVFIFPSFPSINKYMEKDRWIP